MVVKVFECRCGCESKNIYASQYYGQCFKRVLVYMAGISYKPDLVELGLVLAVVGVKEMVVTTDKTNISKKLVNRGWDCIT